MVDSSNCRYDKKKGQSRPGLALRHGASRMLNRQRALLAMLDEAGGTASRLELMKWSFVLHAEMPSRGGPAFYQFVPYRFGPYSFCIYKEVSALSREGLVTEAGDRAWRIRPAGRGIARSLNGEVRRDITKTVSRFSRRNVNGMLEYVYDRYPWFTLNSDHGSRVKRPRAKPAIFTAGYEGVLVDGLLNGFLEAGIQRVIDVRSNPVSRRYGFHKSTLARLCGYVGLDYVHCPELGIRSDKRRGLDTPADYAALLADYESSTLPARADSVDKVASMMRDTPSALVCMEADHRLCHRSRLARAVSEAADLPVTHLEFVR